jgi:hypothetical protein
MQLNNKIIDMKRFAILIGSIVLILASCKKDNYPKDYNEVIKNKSWWGQFTNSGETGQYYSIYFNGNGTLLWSQRGGDYTGNWIVDKNQLTIDLPVPAVQIKATISNESTLKNILTNNSLVVNSGTIITNPTIPLDNTLWKGILSLVNGAQESFQLDFKGGSKVEPKAGANSFGSLSYTRSVSGAVIRFTGGIYPYFGVISSDNEIKGHWSTTPTNYLLWQTVKQ